MHPKSFVSNFWGAVQTLPKGREFFLVVFEEVVVTILFMKKVGM